MRLSEALMQAVQMEATSAVSKVADYFIAQARKKGLKADIGTTGRRGGGESWSIDIRHPDDIRRFTVNFVELPKGVLAQVVRQIGDREKVDQFGILPSNPKAGWKRLWDRWLSILG